MEAILTVKLAVHLKYDFFNGATEIKVGMNQGAVVNSTGFADDFARIGFNLVGKKPQFLELVHSFFQSCCPDVHFHSSVV